MAYTPTQLAKFKGLTVEVKWGDAHSLDPWTPLEELTEDCLVALPCSTYGIVIGTSPDGIMVAAAINAAACTGGNWFIPRGMIEAITVLEPKGDNREAKRLAGDSGPGSPDAAGRSGEGGRRSRRYFRRRAGS
jgi:hypothetical protein